MKSARMAILLGGLALGASGCFVTTYLLQPEQRLLIKNLCKSLDSGKHELKENLEKDGWDAIVRITEDMSATTRKLQGIAPKKDSSDFQARALELEHDLTLIAREARTKNGEAIQGHVREMSFTCESCHRKFRGGRPW